MIRTEILKKASDVVNGDRDQTYGQPEDNFRIIAELWSAYKGVLFTSTDVGAMMALLKIARIRSNPEKADNYIDLAGYAACAAECANKEGAPK